MWSDNETSLDLININHYVSSILELVSDETLLPLTVGVFGDWGNGKSSLLKMVKEKLDTEEDTLCLTFNGWLFEDYDDAKAALIGTILDEIEKRPTLSAAAKKIIIRLRDRVNWLGLMGVAGKYGLSALLGGPAGIAATLTVDAGKQIIDKIKGGELTDLSSIIKTPATDSTEVRKNITEFRKEFTQLLDESKINKLIVIIDDLDRCLPDTIINTLEAVKLFLSSKNTAFLISIDERVIKHAINIRYNSFDARQREEISRDYVEKLIQIPLRVPLMNKNEMKSYINLLFASKHFSDKDFQSLLQKVNTSKQGNNFNISIDLKWFQKNSTLSDELKEELMITEQINDLLYSFLKGNPRQVKRFINALLLRMKLGRLRGVEVKKQVLAKLMALEYMHITHFRQLADWQSTQNGKPQEIFDLEKQAKDKGEVEDSDGWLKNDWVKKWLLTEPALKGVSLEPYFYISRDSITYFASQTLALTEGERKVFDDLISPTATHKSRGKKSFSAMSDPEALNIVNALVDHCVKSDLNAEGKDLLRTLASVSYTKLNVTKNILEFIDSLDVAVIEPAVVLELKEAQKAVREEDKVKITELFKKFGKSSNAMLAASVNS